MAKGDDWVDEAHVILREHKGDARHDLSAGSNLYSFDRKA